MRSFESAEDAVAYFRQEFTTLQPRLLSEARACLGRWPSLQRHLDADDLVQATWERVEKGVRCRFMDGRGDTVRPLATGLFFTTLRREYLDRARVTHRRPLADHAHCERLARTGDEAWDVVSPSRGALQDPTAREAMLRHSMAGLAGVVHDEVGPALAEMPAAKREILMGVDRHESRRSPRERKALERARAWILGPVDRAIDSAGLTQHLSHCPAHGRVDGAIRILLATGWQAPTACTALTPFDG